MEDSHREMQYLLALQMKGRKKEYGWLLEAGKVKEIDFPL